MTFSLNKHKFIFKKIIAKALITVFIWGLFCSLITTVNANNSEQRIFTDTVFTFTLDNTEYRLYGLTAPILYKDEISSKINALISKTNLTYPALSKNKYAVTYTTPKDKANQPFLHKELLKNGLAVLNQNGLGHPDIASLTALEDEARNKKIGLWQDPTFFVLDHHKSCVSCFGIISGKVINITEKKETTFINFGDDWKTDFTLMVSKDIWEDHYKSKIQMSDTIETRGFIEHYYGPMIKIEHKNLIKKGSDNRP